MATAPFRIVNPIAGTRGASEAAARETALQRLVTTFVITGLFFVLLPGTFLGVWNLVSIANGQAAGRISHAWMQAHGQAQMFGWIGTFVIGIGFYSLSKMGRLMPFAIARGWQSWAVWTSGVTLHWIAGVYGCEWRATFPLSALLMLIGFGLFFVTVRQHKSTADDSQPKRPMQAWMRLVIASTFAFLAALLINACGAIEAGLRGEAPELPHALDSLLLMVAAWGFLTISVWGFNARWLPVFAGLKQPRERVLLWAPGVLAAAVIAGALGAGVFSGALLIVACAMAACALRVFEPAAQPAKVQNIHSSFPYFVRGAYVWLLVAASLALATALLDLHAGFVGASRHALTVGFLSTMVFSIGPRILPAFCGMRVLFSKRLMSWSLALLNMGCLLRVASEIPAYEWSASLAWQVLPFSAVIELTAVALFVANMAATFTMPPAHLQTKRK